MVDSFAQKHKEGEGDDRNAPNQFHERQHRLQDRDGAVRCIMIMQLTGLYLAVSLKILSDSFGECGVVN